MSNARRFWNAFRLPVLLALGQAAFDQHPDWWQRLIIWQSRVNPFHDFFCARPSTHDCFFFLPTTLLEASNTASLLTYLFAVTVVLLAAEWLLPRRRTPRHDRLVMIAAALLAAAPWTLLDLQGPNVRLLPVIGALALLLWAFLALNSGLPAVERLAEHPAACRLLEWTFPVSDWFAFKLHQRRCGASAGWLRYVPVGSCLAALGLAVGLQQAALWKSAPMARLPASPVHPAALVPDGTRIWYADLGRYDAGVWRYDEGAAEAVSSVRAAEAASFALQNGYLYLYDGFHSEVIKAHPDTQEIAWRVPVPRKFGPVEVAASGGRIFAVARGGYVAVLDEEGHRLAERIIADALWNPVPLSDGSIAVVSPFRATVRLLTPSLEERVLPLPVSPKVRELLEQDGAGKFPLVTGPAVTEPMKTLWIAALWGEIYRYDLQQGSWLPPFPSRPGSRAIAMDSAGNRLFVYSHARGLMDVIDTASGRRLASARGPVFGSRLAFDAGRRAVLLSAYGPGYTSIPKFGGVYRYETAASAARVQAAGGG